MHFCRLIKSLTYIEVHKLQLRVYFSNTIHAALNYNKCILLLIDMSSNSNKQNCYLLFTVNVYTLYEGCHILWARFHNQRFTLSGNPHNCI